jgi:hypothetical protein
MQSKQEMKIFKEGENRPVDLQPTVFKKKTTELAGKLKTKKCTSINRSRWRR